MGLPVKTIADVLALNKEDILKRRLATIVWKRQIAHTAKHARQMIVHKKVLVNNCVIDVPGYLVPVSDEHSIVAKKSYAVKHAVMEVVKDE